MLQHLYNAVFIGLLQLASAEEGTQKMPFRLSSSLLEGFRHKASSASPLGSRLGGWFSKGLE
jgi:hypothetical protein